MGVDVLHGNEANRIEERVHGKVHEIQVLLAKAFYFLIHYLLIINRTKT